MFETTISDPALAGVCERFRIRRLSLFGSALRNELRPGSDIDLLIEFEPGQTPDFFTLFDLEAELSGHFGGRPLDIVTLPALNRHLRARILASARVLYEQN